LFVVLILVTLSATVLLSSIFVTFRSDQRITRMRTHGLASRALVIQCRGNLGGSGSTNAGFGCEVAYTVHHHRYYVNLQNSLTENRTGQSLSVVADPQTPTFVESSVNADSATVPLARQVVLYGVLVAGLLVICVLALRRLRRRASLDGHHSSS
jgi:hypothetical protein